jgi:MYXO-CTERM domain-containing protein
MRRSPRSLRLFAPLLAPLLAPFLAVALGASTASAEGPYVTVVDDGFLETHALKTQADATAIQNRLFELYASTGSEVPNVVSVWTTFPFAGSQIGTYFMPWGAHVKGIGLEAFYPGGLLTSPHPPLDAILMHNDVTALAARAQKQHAPEEGFASYLFLLELSHLWGPALKIPGTNKNQLVGFPFHWSFWMDAGGSPAGGNVWKDNGDGSYTAVAQAPGAMKYSMVDLYIMGLAGREEVSPFGVLEGAVPPAGVTDPLWGGVYAAHSFPWFDGASPFTVTATRKEITIDDVIAATGERDPAFGASPTSWKLGIMLVVADKDTPEEVDAVKAVFDPIAASLAPAFHDATSQRGTLDVVTPPVAADAGAGGSGVGGMGVGGGSVGGASVGGSGGGESGGGGGTSTSTSADTGCGCGVVGEKSGWGEGALLVLMAMAAMRRRRAR